MKTCAFIFFFSLLPFFLFSQFDSNVIQLGNEGSEDIVATFPDNIDGFWGAGTFSGSIDIGGGFASAGETDIWWGKWTVNQSPVSFFTMGSTRGDELLECKQLENGNLFLSGYFFKTLQLPDTVLDAGNSIKAVFLLEITPDGELVRHQIITGTGQKEIGKVEISEEGLFIAGSFSGELMVDTFVVAASGLEDAFLLKMNSSWKPEVLKSFQSDGRAVGRSLIPISPDTFLFAGHFNGNIQLDTINLVTSTPDFDLFVSKVDAAGNILSANRLGGVYDSRLLGSHFMSDTILVFAGTHRGVINLDENNRIQTQGFNDNFFAFALNLNEDVLWGRSMGGAEDENLQNVAFSAEEIFLVGFGQGGFEIDGKDFQKGPGFSHGFLISLNPFDGALQWYSNLQGSEFVISKAIGKGNTDDVYWGLSFSKDLYANNATQTSNGFYDVLFGKLKEGLSSDNEILVRDELLVFPNPFQDAFLITPFVPGSRFEIYDQQGRKVDSNADNGNIQVNGPAGVYFLKVISDDATSVHKIIKSQ